MKRDYIKLTNLYTIHICDLDQVGAIASARLGLQWCSLSLYKHVYQHNPLKSMCGLVSGSSESQLGCSRLHTVF
jgi:hypothetical protein